MKKTLLNIAISLSLSSAVLSTPAYADSQITPDNTNSNEETTETYMLPGMGIGAATGVAIAGPVGLVVGGLIGAFVGSSQEASAEKNVSQEQQLVVEYDNNKTSEVHAEIDSIDLPSVQVAQLGSINTVAENSISTHNNDLLDILTTDLSLDIYFRSGSTNIETFYPARLIAISNLMKKMNRLELHLDGYTDRRGDKAQNIALANQRLDNVRQQLIDSGVEENRIISKAFGEMKMVSQPGDLEAYTFDRKVVIRFERSSADSIHAMTATLSGTKSKIEAAPVIAEAATRF